MTEHEQELLPVLVSIETKLTQERLEGLLHNLSELGVSHTLNIEIIGNEPEPHRSLDKAQFTRHWNPAGAGQAWSKLLRASREHETFPLRVEETETGEQVLTGEVSEALHWLDANKIRGIGSGVAVTILGRIIEERQAETDQ